MNLDYWVRLWRDHRDLSPEEKQIAENIAANSHWIDKPRSVRIADVHRFLDSVVWIISTDWSKHRDELRAYKAALPYLKSVGAVDAIQKPISAYGGVYGAVSARESTADLRRALKALALDITGKPCNDLVASVINASLKNGAAIVEPHNIDRL